MGRSLETDGLSENGRRQQAAAPAAASYAAGARNGSQGHLPTAHTSPVEVKFSWRSFILSVAILEQASADMCIMMVSGVSALTSM